MFAFYNLQYIKYYCVLAPLQKSLTYLHKPKVCYDNYLYAYKNDLS